jgi:hypothetical protein
MHIRRLITIAENPSIIIRSLKKGKTTTVPGVPTTVFFASIFEKITNNKKQTLQMKVNLEKNERNFIKIKCFEKLSTK